MVAMVVVVIEVGWSVGRVSPCLGRRGCFYGILLDSKWH